jgi:hypothetical protein
MRHLLIAALVAAPGLATAEVLDVQPVIDDVWALVGPMQQRDAENLANNATFGVVVTEAGVVLIDPGGSYQGAAMIDAAIDGITDRPVTHVINTGGQDHRWLGIWWIGSRMNRSGSEVQTLQMYSYGVRRPRVLSRRAKL